MFRDFPDLMKITKIRPVDKKVDKQEITIYRPISIFPAFSEVLEILKYKIVVTFLNIA
jgi:hypothetical protein